VFDHDNGRAEPLSGFGHSKAGRARADNAEIGGQNASQTEPLVPQRRSVAGVLEQWR
jgi:hypothetical protein